MQNLIGKTITIMCSNYFYSGELVDVNSEFVTLKDPKIVYNTGSWDNANWEDVQELPCELYYIQKSSFESFGILK